MKFLLAQILILMGIGKVYAGTSQVIKDLVPEAKESSHEGGDRPSGSCSGCTGCH